MSDLEVRYLGRDAEEFGDYLYEIWRDGVRIAEFRHDFRGEEARMRTGGDWAWCDYPFEGIPPDKVSAAGIAALQALGVRDL